MWKVDASGNFESSIKANLWEDELKFGVDINLDGIDSGKKITFMAVLETILSMVELEMIL